MDRNWSLLFCTIRWEIKKHGIQPENWLIKSVSLTAIILHIHTVQKIMSSGRIFKSRKYHILTDLCSTEEVYALNQTLIRFLNSN